MADETDLFSLRWNNFQNNLASGFHALLQDEALVDVTLAADGKLIHAHKIVLSVCSPYFQEIFKANPCKHPVVILKDTSYQDLQAILEFMYKGEVNVRQEELTDFLKTGEALQIKGLTDESSPDDQSNPISVVDLPPRARTKDRWHPKRHSAAPSLPAERVRRQQSPLPAFPPKRSRVDSAPLPIPLGSSIVPLPSGSSVLPVPSGSSILPVPSGSSILPVSTESSLLPILSGSSLLPISAPSTSQAKAISNTEFIDVPKIEPIDLDSDTDEVDDKDNAMMQLLGVGGEASLSRHDDNSHQSHYDNSLSHQDSNQSLMDSNQGANQSLMDHGQANLNTQGLGMFSGIGGNSHGGTLDASQEGSQDVQMYPYQNSTEYLKDRHQCNMCCKTFSSPTARNHHVRNTHGEYQGPYTCTMCNKVFKNLSSLRSHKINWHNVRVHRNQHHASIPEDLELELDSSTSN